MNQQHWIDRRLENWSRKLAWHTSRRGFIAKLGTLLAGAAALPLLPISRTMAQQLDSGFDDSTVSGEEGDPSNCNYWRYCGVDGFLSSNCGGTHTSCPPGTEMSPITWIGTCRNPADGRKYLVSYNDCCGSGSCGTRTKSWVFKSTVQIFRQLSYFNKKQMDLAADLDRERTTGVDF